MSRLPAKRVLDPGAIKARLVLAIAGRQVQVRARPMDEHSVATSLLMDQVLPPL